MNTKSDTLFFNSYIHLKNILTFFNTYYEKNIYSNQQFSHFNGKCTK